METSLPNVVLVVVVEHTGEESSGVKDDLFVDSNRNVGTKLMEENSKAVPQRMCTSPYHHRHTRLSTICCKFPEKKGPRTIYHLKWRVSMVVNAAKVVLILAF